MRWDELFDDLESQLEHGLDEEEQALRVEEERVRIARLVLRDRLMTLVEAQAKGSMLSLAVELRSGVTMLLRPTTFGKDWLAADVVSEGIVEAHCVVPLHAVVSVALGRRQLRESLDLWVPTEKPRLVDRIGLAFVLRDLCRRRRAVELVTQTGSLRGTIDRVARDHLDLAVHEPGSERRERNVTQYRLVALDGVQLVRL